MYSTLGNTLSRIFDEIEALTNADDAEAIQAEIEQNYASFEAEGDERICAKFSELSRRLDARVEALTQIAEAA